MAEDRLTLSREQHRRVGVGLDWIDEQKKLLLQRTPSREVNRVPIVAMNLEQITEWTDVVLGRILSPVTDPLEKCMSLTVFGANYSDDSGYKLKHSTLGTTENIGFDDPINISDEDPSVAGQSNSVERKIKTVLGDEIVVTGIPQRLFIKYKSTFLHEKELLSTENEIWDIELEGETLVWTPWEALGDTELIRPYYPVYKQCPISAGNINVCIWKPQYGYGIMGTEEREYINIDRDERLLSDDSGADSVETT